MPSQRGFTLIELMIVVAIIAILSAIALPAYQDYLARAHVSEGLTLASGARTALVDYYAEHARYPVDNDDAGLAAPGSVTGTYVTSVTVGNANGQIDILFGGEASQKITGQTLTMQLTNNGGSLQWDCTGIDERFLPSACR